MKYAVKFTAQFKKDLKLAKKQGKNLDRLFEAVGILAEGAFWRHLFATISFPESMRTSANATSNRMAAGV